MKKAQILIYILIYNAIALIILTGIISWVYIFYSTVTKEIEKKKAVAIAESGIEYYRWRLNHFPKDYTDGTGRSGPYIHNFENRIGNIIGQFELEITPPLIGSTIVKIKSTGKLNFSKVEKIIESKLAIPSLIKFSVLSDDNVRFGQGTVVYGQIHSNKGIRFDGIAYNLISSALITYDDPDHSGCNEWAVHTHIPPQDPCPPSNPDPNTLPPRSDIFKAGREVGRPMVDFVGLSANLAQLKDIASSSGFYRPFSGDNKYGYEIILKENGTFDLYRVDKVKNFPSNCCAYDPYEFNNTTCYRLNSRYLYGTWSIDQKTFLGNYNIPTNGVIFIEDNIWVSGKINNKRLIIASAKFPENPNERTRIIINKDLIYTNYNGNDSIGLIAQKSITVGLESEDDLRIDAALIAQSGRAGRFHYNGTCGNNSIKTNLTIFGTIASRIRYGFAWVSGNNLVSGYQNRNLIYDANLLYSPPPEFPLASEFYETLDWQEIK